MRQHCNIEFRRMGVADQDGPVVQSGNFDVTDWGGYDRDKALQTYRLLRLSDPSIYVLVVLNEAGERIFRWDAAQEILWQNEERARVYREQREFDRELKA